MIQRLKRRHGIQNPDIKPRNQENLYRDNQSVIQERPLPLQIKLQSATYNRGKPQSCGLKRRMPVPINQTVGHIFDHRQSLNKQKQLNIDLYTVMNTRIHWGKIQLLTFKLNQVTQFFEVHHIPKLRIGYTACDQKPTDHQTLLSTMANSDQKRSCQIFLS